MNLFSLHSLPKIIYYSFILFVFALLIIFFCLSIISYESLTSMIQDARPYRIFNFEESFPKSIFNILRWIFISTTVFLLILIFISFRNKKNLQFLFYRGSRSLKLFWERLIYRTYYFFKYVERSHLILLGLILILAVLIRFLELNRSPHHDESKTILGYVTVSWFEVFTNYGVPNNHIFHNFLSRISYLLFGWHLWVFRLPVFICGIFVPVLAYILSRKLFEKNTALISTLLVSFSTPLINYSVNARGYMIMTFIFLLMMLISISFKYRKNYIGWIIFIFLGAIGLWTSTPMAIPLAIVYVWLFFFYLGPELKNFVKLSIAGASTLVLALFLYLPAIYRSGIRNIVANEYITTVSKISAGEMLLELKIYLSELAQFLFAGFTSIGSILLLLFFFIALAIAVIKKGAIYKFLIPHILIVVLFCIWKQILPPVRIFVPLIPSLLIASSFAFVWIYNIGLNKNKINQKKQYYYYFKETGIKFLCFIFSILLFIHIYNKGSSEGINKDETVVEAKEIIEELKPKLDKNTVLQFSTPLAGALLYYCKTHSIENYFWTHSTKTDEENKKLYNYEKIIIIVRSNEVLEHYINTFNYENFGYHEPKLLKKYSDSIIYFTSKG